MWGARRHFDAVKGANEGSCFDSRLTRLGDTTVAETCVFRQRLMKGAADGAALPGALSEAS